ncbi:MAG: tetratricopeptide repeat protein, partial [bacterium]|nr:tetratricopeptide repeat protein [bacterium]
MKQNNGKEISTVNIFVASSSELKEEREEFNRELTSINKSQTHLNLELIRWETDMESGSVLENRIQDKINPLLETSNIVFVLVYSKIGKYTLEEYNLAMEKNKKVFLYFKKGFSPVSVAESKTQQEVLEFKERIDKEENTLYREYETIDQFKHALREDLDIHLARGFPLVSSGGGGMLLTRAPVKNVHLVGRDGDLKEMAGLLERSHCVLLVNGLGGVGKTELCKRYFWDNIHNYRHLAWVDVVGGIRESVVNAFRPEVMGCGEEDSLDERFKKTMGFLDGLDGDSLLVADNIENPDDDDLDRLRTLPVSVIVNSRLNLDGFEPLTLDFLSTEKCKALFYGHYKGQKDDDYLDKITALCGRHTLSVELLARTAQNAAMPIKTLYDTLEKHGFNLNDVIGDGVRTFWHNEKKRKRFFDHLLTIFALSDVTAEERHILANLSVLPPIDIPIADIKEWLKLENNEGINSLVFKGWLKQEEGGFTIFMHQVIQEVIRYETSPDAKECMDLIVSLANKLHLEPADNPIDKKMFIIFVETLLRRMAEKDEELATLSNNLAEIYRHIGRFENALEFQLKAVNIREAVLEKIHPDLANSYNNLSLIYSDLGQQKKALGFQLKAVNICEEALEENHPLLAISYNNLSTIYSDLGQPQKALEF